MRGHTNPDPSHEDEVPSENGGRQAEEEVGASSDTSWGDEGGVCSTWLSTEQNLLTDSRKNLLLLTDSRTNSLAREFVLESVRQGGLPLFYACTDLLPLPEKGCVLRRTFCRDSTGMAVVLAYASDDHLFRADREAVLKAVTRRNGAALAYASNDLRTDIDVVIEAVRQSLAWAHTNLQTGREIDASRKVWIEALADASRNLKKDIDVFEAVRQDAEALVTEALAYAGLRSPMPWLRAVVHNVTVLFYVSDILLLERELLLRVVMAVKYVRALDRSRSDMTFPVSEHNTTSSFSLVSCQGAQHQSDKGGRQAEEEVGASPPSEVTASEIVRAGQVSAHAPRPSPLPFEDASTDKKGGPLSSDRFYFKSHDNMRGTSDDEGGVCSAQVGQPPAWLSARELVLESLDRITRTRELVLESLRHGNLSLFYGTGRAICGFDLRADKEAVLEAVRQDGLLLAYASTKLRADREVVLEAVRQNGTALSYAFDDLQTDRDFVIEAVGQNGLALAYATCNFRADRDVVLEAVTQNPSALRYVSDVLWLDREFLLDAVGQNALALNVKYGYALGLGYDRNDRTLMLQAVGRNGLALEHVPREFQSDEEFVHTAVAQNPTAWKYARGQFRTLASVQNSVQFRTEFCDRNDRTFMLHDLEHVPRKFQSDEEVVHTAVAQNPTAQKLSKIGRDDDEYHPGAVVRWYEVDDIPRPPSAMV